MPAVFKGLRAEGFDPFWGRAALPVRFFSTVNSLGFRVSSVYA